MLLDELLLLLQLTVTGVLHQLLLHRDELSQLDLTVLLVYVLLLSQLLHKVGYLFLAAVVQDLRHIDGAHHLIVLLKYLLRPELLHLLLSLNEVLDPGIEVVVELLLQLLLLLVLLLDIAEETLDLVVDLSSLVLWLDWLLVL